MTITIHEVLSALRTAGPNVERGTRFEELMVDFIRLDPELAGHYDQVSRWVDWTHRGSSVDVGIDLVARERDTGGWTAIQCKFYEPTHWLGKADIDSFFTASGKTWNGQQFSNRIIISTTDKWSKHAEEALDGQVVPVQRIGVEQLAESSVDWAFTDKATVQVELRLARKYSVRQHQRQAIDAIRAGFAEHDRGQWISACGTGKTFTSLRLAEELAGANGGSLRVLFLAPSIQLVSQTLREWTAHASLDLRAAVVCSDTKSSRAAEDISPHDIPLPATTDPQALYQRLAVARRAAGLSVVFATYQSLDVVAQAQQLGAADFDLVLCDEAHRTTGVTLAGVDESAFVRVHNHIYLRAGKRLYMTATPRIFGDDVKERADEHSAVLASMDDEATFGPVFHRLGFGQAVEADLLTDYKVLVLVVSEEQMTGPVQDMVADDNLEIPLDDAAKILGCWNTLAKRTHPADPDPAFPPDAVPMKRAVGFLDNIKSSKRVAAAFEQVVTAAAGPDATGQLAVEAHHVDGTMNALARAAELTWLKAPVTDGQCRILTNARCLSEGVDVPDLDAVLFLSPRNSAVDVVQSVGRVMRKAPGKQFGYIILPVAVPVGVDPATALRDNKRFKVVWNVLNALRAHDDRFDAIISSINLNGGKDPSGRLIIDTPGTPDGDTSGQAVQLPLFALDKWRDAIYSRIVDRVGTREYWDRWAQDVSSMSAAQVARINTILARSTPDVTDRFDAFLAGLRANLNESITRDDAISMLSQHLITAPVFDALFGDSGFATRNPVSIGMQAMLDVLEGQGLDTETEHLDRFYKSVQLRASQVTDAAGKQSVIHDLYEKFFRNAFPKQAESLGVVYTPVDIVDFILRATDTLLRRHFHQGLTDPGITILDPFTGTGTFPVRLLQSGLIQPADLERKYHHELWANEIMLLAYYIACVNIETTYAALTDADTYEPFPGAIMTDTFQISEAGDRADTSLLPVNNDRITAQVDTPITVIVGNPPYSVGQTTANDNNANLAYPTLDARIRDTYAARSTATNKNSLYDSYIRAYRWATDRLQGHGIVAFVSNGGWLDGNTAAGMRLSLQDDYSELWIFNLRGNQRTAGEQSRREGGKVFGSGSRNTVAITIGIQHPDHTGPATIRYRDIGDYLTREQKLDILTTATLDDDTAWEPITPNDHGDWLNRRDNTYQAFTPIGTKDAEPAIFTVYSNGLKTNRDAWCYNFRHALVEHNMRAMIDTYNESLECPLPDDPTRISWNRSLLKDHDRGIARTFQPTGIRPALYRPFTKQTAYFDRTLNDMVYRMPSIFPTANTPNVGFLVISPHPQAKFSVLATDLLPDCATYVITSQFFPRWTYEPAARRAQIDELFSLDEGEVVDGWRRVDNITDHALAQYRAAFGHQVTKDDIFSCVYAVLHSPTYRAQYEADLRKMLPRIPLASSVDEFHAFTDAGRRLLDLHIGYETVEPYPLQESIQAPVDLSDADLYRVVKKMRYPKHGSHTDRSTLIYNDHITLHGIPDQAHDYQLGSRSALDWIIDRYWIRTDKPSGIVNDPNNPTNPRHILDLIKRVTTVSVETMRIIRALPSVRESNSAIRRDRMQP